MTPAASPEEPTIPSADAMLAGTVALMTAWADPCPTCTLDSGAHRNLLARKIVSNLFFLHHHPAVAEGLRRVLLQAHGHWVRLAQAGGVAVMPAEARPGPALH